MKKLSINKLQLRNKIIILSSLALLVAGGSVFFVLLPSQSKLLNIKTRVEEIQHEQGITESSTNNLIRAKGRISEVSDTLDKINEAYVPKDNPIYLVAIIEELAEGRNIEAEIDIEHDAADINSEEITPVEIQLTLNGPMQPILEFLNDISTASVYIEPVKLNILQVPDAAENLNGDTSVSAEFKALTYWN